MNSFKLHRLPVPRSDQVLGLVGTNGIGKSTALKVLSGNMKPNLGRFDSPPEWKEIFNYFKGSELQKFFMSMIQDEMKALIKIQYVDSVAKSKAASHKVGLKLKAADKKGIMQDAIDALDLDNILERQIGQLSGGEL